MTKATIMEAGKALGTLRHFAPKSQLTAMIEGCDGEEAQFFIEKIIEMSERINTMPKSYEQSECEDPIAYLHYFYGSADFYITEKDIDEDGEGQIQAFGQVDLGHGPEIGYISIEEIISCNIELDLYFDPKPLSQINGTN